MSSDPSVVERIVSALSSAGQVRHRKLFGEYGIYLNKVYSAMICENQLYFKVTPGADAWLDESHLAPPYPGAKPAYRIPESRWDDTEWLVAFLQHTARQLARP